MKKITDDKNPSPKGGMEVGLLSVAVILVLVFVGIAIFPESGKGIKINRITCHLGMTNDGTGAKLEIIEVHGRDKILFRERQFTEKELEEYVSQVYLEKNIVYMINSVPRAEFGLIIKIHDLFREKGIPEDYVIIGGVMYGKA